jgi:hypothetical protein
MTPQVGVNVVCQVRPGQVEPLRAVLAEMGQRPADNECIPFGKLAGVHFARLFLLDDTSAPDGTPIPAQVILMADLDAPLESRLAELADAAGRGLDAVFGHCEGYPRVGTREARLAFLQAHVVRSAAHYTNTIGRTVEQIRREAELREAIEDFLDAQGDWPTRDPGRVRAAIADFVRRDPLVAWAMRPANERDLGWRLREGVWLVAVPLLALIVTLALLPLSVLALMAFVVMLRVNELREPAATEKPTPLHVRELAAIEDWGPQNQYSLVGFIKPSRFWHLTMRAVLFLTDYATHHVFYRANLAGVKTIHFARWVPIDSGRRVIFASSYDGSVEMYNDDFIDKLWWGLNATSGSGQGYPRTRFLLFGGAQDELAFKNVIRAHQVPTQVWYSAYERLTALNIENNARIRAGLGGRMGAADAARWLARL